MGKKKTGNAKEKIDQVLSQAKESLKLLGTFEKETLAKARSFVKIPSTKDRMRMTNDKILSGLRKLGVATQAEVDVLNSKIQELEASVRRPSHSAHSKSASAEAEK